MKNLRRLALPAAFFGAFTLAAPISAENIKDRQNNLSVVSGHNVVDAVDDLRETTADLVGAMREAKGDFAFQNWNKGEAQLKQMEQNLHDMEVTLDKKAEATDSSWLNWMEDRDYTVTVKQQVQALAQSLDELATLLNSAKESKTAQIVVGHNLVDQVDDVRETTKDLIQAVGDAGPEWGWFDDAEQFSGALAELDQMEKSLDRKAEMTDAEWGIFVTSPEYRVSVRDNIKTLSNMVANIADQLSGTERVSQAQE